MRNPTLVMIIGRLAVDRSYQIIGIGSGMLKDALARVLQVSKIARVRAVIVHAIDMNAVSFYTQFGFARFEDSEARTMFLATEKIDKSL